MPNRKSETAFVYLLKVTKSFRPKGWKNGDELKGWKMQEALALAIDCKGENGRTRVKRWMKGTTPEDAILPKIAEVISVPFEVVQAAVNLDRARKALDKIQAKGGRGTAHNAAVSLVQKRTADWTRAQMEHLTVSLDLNFDEARLIHILRGFDGDPGDRAHELTQIILSDTPAGWTRSAADARRAQIREQGKAALERLRAERAAKQGGPKPGPR